MKSVVSTLGGAKPCTPSPKFVLISIVTPLPIYQGRRPSGAVVGWYWWMLRSQIQIIGCISSNFRFYQFFDLSNLIFILQPTTVHQQLLWPPYAFHSIPVCCYGNGSLSTYVLGQMFRPQLIVEAYKAKISPNQPLFKVKSCPGGPKIR